MTELIKIITQIIDSKPKEEQTIILPIETINDLPVVAKISIIPNLLNYLFFIDIDANGIDVEDQHEILPLNFICKFFYEISIENPVINNDEFIDAFKKIVNSLRYDNKTGKIEDGEESDNQFFRELITNPHISFKKEEACCVCSEFTKTKTYCNHTLCLICWSKIKSVEDVKPCPICREELFYEKV
jgi:hypothetical protein